MNSRERVLTALDHREPDRVPFDLGGTIVTGIHLGAHRALRPALGLPPREPQVIDRIQHLALVEDDLKARLLVDTAPVLAGAPGTEVAGGPIPATSRALTSEDDEYTYLYDEWGLGWRCPKDGGLYHDVFLSPLAGDITLDVVDRHQGPDPLDRARLAGMRARCLRIRDEERRASCAWGFGAGIFETAGWLRGIEAFYMDLVGDPALAGRLMDRVLEPKLAWYEVALAEFGDLLDVACEGDDLGGQFTTLISPEMFRRLVKPRLREIFTAIHARSDAKVFFHTCGAVREIIPDLIEIGVDVLNPIQVSAVGMDTAVLKREFGRELAFWGGGVDTQRVLDSGTPAEVRDEVRRRIDDLATGGGFVFAATHNVQANVPPENVVAMREALIEHGHYSSDGEAERRSLDASQ
jgi:uroporphyrinogen decarboxylase